MKMKRTIEMGGAAIHQVKDGEHLFVCKDIGTLSFHEEVDIDALAHEIALEDCKGLLEACLHRDLDGWFALAPDEYDLDRELRYLELRGLLERHPEGGHLVRVTEDSCESNSN